MKYKVELGYNAFVFDNPADACSFAEKAKSTFVSDRYDKTISVTITLVDDAKNEENEEE